MRQAKQTVITEQEVPPINPDDAPNVVAYRVGELEKTLKAGLLALHGKLDELRDGFVSHEQLAEAVKQGDLVHTDQERRISKLERWNEWLVRLVVGAVILAILALALNTKTGL